MKVIAVKESELVGRRFGQLTVVAIAHRSKRGAVMCRCVCDCGGVKIAPYWTLTKATKPLQSCGCGRRFSPKRVGRPTHGESRTRLYNVWNAMLSRCYNPKQKSYANYGGRGIYVCERWLKYVNFRDDMAAGYAPSLTVERNNNDGPYSPENCRWATRAEQVKNQRTTIRHQMWGRAQTAKEWSIELGVPHALVRNRLKHGWDISRAVREPKRCWPTRSPTI